MFDNPGTGTISGGSILCCAVVIVTILMAPQVSSAFDLSTTDDFPYELSAATELALAPAGITLLSLGAMLEKGAHPPTEKEVMTLDENDIPVFDRSAVHHFSKAANTASDVGLIAMESASALLALHQIFHMRKRWKNLLTLGAMYGEAIMLTGGATQVTKILTARPRPFVYSDDVPMASKTNGPYKSFFSGHTSSVFCSALFIGTVFSDLHPRSPWRFVVWGTSLSVATLTGTMRYFAGKHFPSDILVGAAVGSLFGYIVPYLHRKSIWRDTQIRIAILPEVSNRFAGVQFLLGI
jgi:membrane-associated phospholipid phosphatase